jgi:hypothetical protein
MQVRIPLFHTFPVARNLHKLATFDVGYEKLTETNMRKQKQGTSALSQDALISTITMACNYKRATYGATSHL